jgi:tight adherence protein C
MNYALTFSIELTAFLAIALVCVWFMTRPTAAAKRVFGVTRVLPPPGETAKAASGSAPKRLFQLVNLVRARFGITTNDKLRKRFLAAGWRNETTVTVYFVARLLGPLGVILLWTFFRQITFFWVTVMIGAAYLAPEMCLSATIKRRRERIRLGLPDALDLMVVCVDAGLGLDQALLRTGQELGLSHAILADELMQLNLEQRAGKPRVDAWRDLADRTELDTVKAFANVLAQSDRFGTPVAKALSTFADGLRKQRSQQAEEMAARATIKLLFPLVLFIFPSMFIVLLGPAVLTISRNLGAIGGK